MFTLVRKYITYFNIKKQENHEIIALPLVKFYLPDYLLNFFTPSWM